MMDTKTKPNQSAVYRNPKAKNGFITESKGKNKGKTIYECFMYNIKNNPKKKCLGTILNKQYVWKSYEEISKIVTNFGSGLINTFNLKTKQSFGIYAKNREEWVVAERACNAYNFICVPLYGFIIFKFRNTWG
jgi:long-subunit acyl-CoA synthetase (AMP-forming)